MTWNIQNNRKDSPQCELSNEVSREILSENVLKLQLYLLIFLFLEL